MFYVTNCYTLVQGEYLQVVVKKKKKKKTLAHDLFEFLDNAVKTIL